MSDLRGVPLRVESLTKRFGRSVTAVRDLSFAVQPGRVTGFLGPNGSGKTTTLRCLLGLVRPSSGRATVDGTDYRALPSPLQVVGAALEASSFYPGRTGRNHLRVVAAAAGLPTGRADEVLELVGLTDAGRRRVVEYSLGMRQRLALATALLGDPGVLVLDEPANGLDPEGIAWLRGFLRDRADRGGTVLVSSHVLAEVQQTVDDVVIIHRGSLVHAGPLAGLSRGGRVIVRSPDAERLIDRLAESAPGAVIERRADGALSVAGMAASQIGRLALDCGCELHELTPEADDLERVFLELTADSPDAEGSR